ncbi:MAG: hypothetical protein JWO25_1239 [Alphaproteobacteria bacterium]|nr:hypothetical protein [Alphaproteobacteria bacterium]MDB5721972.1 hypothetical protein [Alphaproteobacteria bacterium]
MIVRWLAVAALAIAAAPATAETALPERTINLVVYGADPCPKSKDDEIVVCARRPEAERYRIPKPFRNPRRTDTASMAWGQQWSQMEDSTRFTRPDSCSVVGTGGQTGCMQSSLRQWWLERRAGY